MDSNTGFDVFFDISLNKRLNKQTRSRWFQTPSHSLWRHGSEGYVVENRLNQKSREISFILNIPITFPIVLKLCSVRGSIIAMLHAKFRDYSFGGVPNIATMMTSSNGNIFRVTGPLWGEFTGDRCIPFAKASDAALHVFFGLRLNKRLGKPSRRQWFETPSRLWWRHCNASLLWNVPYFRIANVFRYVMALQWHHMWTMTSDISGNSTICSPSCSGLQQRKHQSFASLALCEGNLPLTSGDLHHKGPVMQTAFLCHEVMMDIIPFWQVLFFPSASAKHDATGHLLVWHPRLKQRYPRKPLHWLL